MDSMDTQTLINTVIAVAAFLGSFVLNRIIKSLDRLDDDMRKIPEKFLQKDDYHRDIDEVKVLLKSIFDKLDNKADK
jgi:hypothetical protein